MGPSLDATFSFIMVQETRIMHLQAYVSNTVTGATNSLYLLRTIYLDLSEA